MPSLFHVSERSHSGFLVMTKLAEAYPNSETFISLQEIARDMGLSEGYLEEIALALKKAALIQGRQGPGGGYRLRGEPSHISAEQIFVALEGPVQLVDCQKSEADCPAQHKCSSKGFWKILQTNLLHTLRETTLQDITRL